MSFGGFIKQAFQNKILEEGTRHFSRLSWRPEVECVLSHPNQLIIDPVPDLVSQGKHIAKRIIMIQENVSWLSNKSMPTEGTRCLPRPRQNINPTIASKGIKNFGKFTI